MKTPEQLQKHLKRQKQCEKNFVLLTTSQKSNAKTKQPIFSIFAKKCECSSYFCEKCSKKKRNIFYAKIANAMQGNTWRFLTLTIPKTNNSIKEDSEKIASSWNKLITAIKKHKPHIKFIKIQEVGKNNNVHLHILLNCYLERSFIKELWQKYCGAYIIDIRRIDSLQKALGYITKYFTKGFGNNEKNEIFFLNQLRRYSISRNFVPKYDKIYNFSILEKGLKNLNQIKDNIIVYMHLYDNFELAEWNPPEVLKAVAPF